MEQKENESGPRQGGKRWLGGYIIAGAVWYFAQNFRTTAASELIVVVIAVLAGYYYYTLKSKIRIKNEVARIIITFFILEIAAGFSIGLLTTIANRLVR